jgi:type IV secretory pathway TrbF-like protein
MHGVPDVQGNGVPPAPDLQTVQHDLDALDAVLAQNMEKLKWLQWVQWMAAGSTAVALVCALLAVWGWFFRPEVVPLVKLVHVDQEGVAREVRTIAMADYTPADWQWVGMLRQWVLDLRWRGLDVRGTHFAWERLRATSCGEAVEQLKRYQTLDEPFKHIGVRTRDVLNINVTKGDIDGLWTVLWDEVSVDGARPKVETHQSVSFAVARRPVTAAMEQINGYGLCVKKFGGLKLRDADGRLL